MKTQLRYDFDWVDGRKEGSQEEKREKNTVEEQKKDGGKVENWKREEGEKIEREEGREKRGREEGRNGEESDSKFLLSLTNMQSKVK